MSLQQMLSQLKVVPISIQEMIDLFHQIPNTDKDKYSFYKNIETLINLEIEKERNSKTKIRLLNGYESGQIDLNQLSQTSKYIQEAYTSAIGKQVGVSDGRNKYYRTLRENTKIIASIEAGSFIISVDKIGESTLNEEADIILENLEKEALFNDLIKKIYTLSNDESIDSFIEEFGYKTLKHIQSWFENLFNESTPFEVLNQDENIKEFTLEKISFVKNKIQSIKFLEQKEDITVFGKLLAIDSIKDRIAIREKTLGDIEIKVPKGILQDDNVGNELQLNKSYKFTVTKQTIKYPSKTTNLYLLVNRTRI